MKCPVCWTEKAYRREIKGWQRFVLKIFMMVPMRCHHCYHKFHAFMPLTWGKVVDPPPLRVVPLPDGQARRISRRVSRGKSRTRPTNTTSSGNDQNNRLRRSA